MIKRFVIKLLNIFKKFLHIFPHKKYVLLLSSGLTMDDHIVRFYNIIKNEKYKIKAVFLSNNKITNRHKNYDIEDKRIIKSNLKFILSNPDLIVVADIYHFGIFDAKKIYVGHGTSTITGKNSEDAYCYSHAIDKDGKLIYNYIFETSKVIFEDYNKDPRFKDIVVWSGHKYSQNFDNDMLKYEEYRKSLGIEKDQKAIFLIGSWKPDSLFQQLGKDIFEEIKELAKDSKYKFILSIHPNEYMDEARYKSQFPNNEPFGKYVDEMVNYNCIVRKVGEEFMPYLVASDLVICDYSSMADNAIMCEKNLIYSEFGDDGLYKLSSSMRLKKILPVLHNAKELSTLIKEEYNEDNKKHVLNIKEEMYAPSGHYERACIQAVEKLLRKK